MTKTLIALDDKDKAWLETASRRAGQTVAETVRKAIRSYRLKEEGSSRKLVLRETAGTWGKLKEDGLAFNDRQRAEWDR